MNTLHCVLKAPKYEKKTCILYITTLTEDSNNIFDPKTLNFNKKDAKLRPIIIRLLQYKDIVSRSFLYATNLKAWVTKLIKTCPTEVLKEDHSKWMPSKGIKY